VKSRPAFHETRGCATTTTDRRGLGKGKHIDVFAREPCPPAARSGEHTTCPCGSRSRFSSTRKPCCAHVACQESASFEFRAARGSDAVLVDSCEDSTTKHILLTLLGMKQQHNEKVAQLRAQVCRLCVASSPSLVNLVVSRDEDPSAIH
jgi:hypothetical protein